ncbi:WYL domain-containing protein [Luteolibacter soli]|uniref:WYL domain-containing protein n=1 Tax=Luteolibacter soli TaxID=3135280 RepID=A0ABU9AYG3_9BACT
MRVSASLNEIRSAVRGGRRVAFEHGREKVVADLYMLGHSKKTGAYVVVAWCHEPVQEWRHFRFSMMYDIEPLGEIERFREDFNPNDPKLVAIDCMVPYLPPRRHH